MSIPQGQNPYPGYPPQAGPPQSGDPSRPMYPSGAGSPYPSAAAPTSFPGGGMGRRASSRTLPIIVGVGVAVGVFGGLMIIRGTGNSSADPGTEPPVLQGSNGNAEDNGKPEGKPDEPQVPTQPDEGTAVAAVEVDAAPPPVTPPKPEKRTVTLRFQVSPEDADIEVDGKPVKDGALALELAADERKNVEVVVKAEGYEPWTKKVAVSTSGDEQAVEVELAKKRTTPVRRPPRPPRDDDRRRDRDRRQGGGIIDL
jgi:hypothetical protein